MEAKQFIVKINGRELKAKQNFKTIFHYQETTGKNPFLFENIEDQMRYLHSSLIANNEGFDIGFDKFIELVNDDLQLINLVTAFVTPEDIGEGEQLTDDEVKKK